jgi:hypothetical protein
VKLMLAIDNSLVVYMIVDRRIFLFRLVLSANVLYACAFQSVYLILRCYRSTCAQYISSVIPLVQ